ncbi:hypothetical protein AB3X30_21995 [Raoultella terrigena]|uniref:hypothetical protein n=1 Tax=Raoultella terrigena TaxID=577 RepID=UPI00349F7AC0
MSQINLITTCTNGKHSNGCPILNLATWSSHLSSSQGLIQAWCQAVNLSISAGHTLPVEKLYKGGHWTTAMSIFNSYPVELWILSAGLGLLKRGDKVVPYQATFAVGHNDSIPLFSGLYNGKEFHQKWWAELTKHSSFQEEHPVSLTELMKTRPNEYFIICGSPDYISAIGTDIKTGLPYLHSAEKQFLIISSSRVKSPLNHYLLESNKRIAEWLNSNMLMLNIKIAQYVIEQFTREEHDNLGLLADRLNKQFSSLPATCKKQGVRRTPEQVEAWVLQHLSEVSDTSASRALRVFRDSGNSFEEKRFRTLFHSVQLRNQ